MSKTWKTSNQQYGTHYGRSSSQPRSKIGRSTLEYLESLDQGNFIHEQEKIAQRERHGLFTQPLGLSPGDAYEDPKAAKPSKRMQVNQRLQEKVGPELFSKFGSTNIGDPYQDRFRAQQLYLKQKVDMNIHSTAFNAGGKQKLVKNSQFDHRKQYDDKQYNTRDDNGNIITAKKGIFTNNMKKGFGNTTAGHLFSHYPYQGFPDDDPRKQQSNERLLHKAKIPTPFKGLSHPNPAFTPNYTLYNTCEPYQPKNQDEQFRGRSTGGNWKYNNPGKKGKNGTFTSFPQYIENGEKIKLPPKQENIWIPNFNGTSKGIGETLSKPCPAPSQLILNQMRQLS